MLSCLIPTINIILYKAPVEYHFMYNGPVTGIKNLLSETKNEKS